MRELEDLLGELDALRGGELGSWWLSRLRNLELTRNLDCEPLRSRETEFCCPHEFHTLRLVAVQGRLLHNCITI
jgi:hypothetical protein